jgi:short-subunit dehydrogenase
MDIQTRPVALVTGGSTGIGFHLARQFAEHGYDLLVCADEDEIETAAESLAGLGGSVRPLRVDLGTREGVEWLASEATAEGRLQAVAINAGTGGAGSFLEIPLDDDLRTIDLNVSSSVHLAKRVLPHLIMRGDGKLLITSSVAARTPAPYQATYAASKAFLSSFAEAIRHELRGTGVTVTVLMPGPTETAFFARAGIQNNTLVGMMRKDDPAEVAREAFEGLMAGKARVVPGSPLNWVQTEVSRVLPDRVKAAAYAVLSKPRS